jgi:predicted phage terminase large subunit-like protein
MCAARKDPSVLGAGYKSREIIGKHPGLLVIDDIHDENNSASARELETVKKTLTGTILPTATKDTFQINVGTPWTENDALAYLKATGEYICVKTPVVDEAGKLAFPRVCTPEFLESKKRTSGAIEYARMYLLDLTASQNRVFKYQLYPHENIKHNWPMMGGADYAGTMDEFKNRTGDNDYFALAYVAKLPGGGAVVVDGVMVRCTQAEAELYIKQAQNIWPMWLGCVVEGDGKGEEFIQVLKRNPGMKIIPMKTGGKGKFARLERQMGPWLENGSVRISDADTPFLNGLRNFLDSYPNATYDDTGDALYWALRGMPDVTVMPNNFDEIPEAVMRVRKPNPFKALAGAR